MVGVRPMMSPEVHSLVVTGYQEVEEEGGVEGEGEGEGEELLHNRCRYLGRRYLGRRYLGRLSPQGLGLLTLRHDLWWNMIQARLRTKRVRIRIWIQSKMLSLQNHSYQKMCKWCQVMISVPLWKS